MIEIEDEIVWGRKGRQGCICTVCHKENTRREDESQEQDTSLEVGSAQCGR